jgi:hypothetical protein
MKGVQMQLAMARALPATATASGGIDSRQGTFKDVRHSWRTNSSSTPSTGTLPFRLLVPQCAPRVPTASATQTAEDATERRPTDARIKRKNGDGYDDHTCVSLICVCADQEARSAAAAAASPKGRRTATEELRDMRQCHTPNQPSADAAVALTEQGWRFRLGSPHLPPPALSLPSPPLPSPPRRRAQGAAAGQSTAKGAGRLADAAAAAGKPAHRWLSASLRPCNSAPCAAVRLVRRAFLLLPPAATSTPRLLRCPGEGGAAGLTHCSLSLRHWTCLSSGPGRAPVA